MNVRVCLHSCVDLSRPIGVNPGKVGSRDSQILVAGMVVGVVDGSWNIIRPISYNAQEVCVKAVTFQEK